jgi:hypothetical protein
LQDDVSEENNQTAGSAVTKWMIDNKTTQENTKTTNEFKKTNGIASRPCANHNHSTTYGSYLGGQQFKGVRTPHSDSRFAHACLNF